MCVSWKKPASKKNTTTNKKSSIVVKICGYYSLYSAKNKIQSQEVVFNFICYLKVHDICSVETKSKEKR